MKKRFKVITVIAIILILGILILFCSKVDKISLIENIRQKIAKTEEIENGNEVTRIDITDLEDGGIVEHKHTFKTMYDENVHWEECTICKEKQKENIHTFSRTWSLGTESCYKGNSYKDACLCGYSKIGHKPCVWRGKYDIWGSHRHSKVCENCNDQITYSYYLNTYGSGQVYLISEANEKCYTSNETLLTCLNSGTCNICKRVYSFNNGHILYGFYGTDKISCLGCDQNYGTCTKSIQKVESSIGTYIFTTKISLKNGATFRDICNWATPGLQLCNQTIMSRSSAETEIIIESVIKVQSNWKIGIIPYVQFYVNVNGENTVMQVYTDDYIFIDWEKPTILTVTMGDGSEDLTEWSRTKPIFISGGENYCDVVNVKIVDDEENVVFSGDANVVGNNYSISCTPEIECDTNGRTFKVIVTDTCENSIEQEFTIAKVDSIAPKPKSDTEILGDWAKSKNFTFKATDGGIGNVSIAFNDIEDLQLANSNGIEYSRDYEFVGDVYRQKELSVLYRDGLGNTSMQKIVIDKIDNTAPTILETRFHNNKLIIKSNDEKEGLGEGSGVVKYRYFTSREKIENPEIPDSEKEVDKDDEIIIDDIVNSKYVYIVAEDYVGNVSKVYEVEVPKLVLTSEVQLDGSNGKGAVKLDWSSYDIEDKYFVIYRKEEKAEDWETIVSLDEKFNGSSYIDNLANDKKVPNDPNIVINGNQENNSINISASASDRGSKYTYYIEAYDNTCTLINISNTQYYN